MAPIDPNNTPRFWLDYSDGLHNHSQMWRCADNTQFEELMIVVNAFWNAIDSSFYEITILGARVALRLSDISSPIAWTGSNTFGTGAITPFNSPRELRWEGRDAGGAKVSWSAYGFSGGGPGTYRFLAGEVAALDDGTSQIQGGIDDGIIVTAAGLAPILKTYINFNFNSYWERKQR